MRLGDLDNPAPRVDISRGMPRLWTNTTLKRPTNKSLLTINLELSAVSRDLSRPILEMLRVAGRELYDNRVQDRPKLVPRMMAAFGQRATTLYDPTCC